MCKKTERRDPDMFESFFIFACLFAVVCVVGCFAIKALG